MVKPKSLLWIGALPLAAGLAAAGLALEKRHRPTAPSPPPLQDLGQVPDFKLKDSAGRKIGLKDIPGPWVADFIFTSCRGLCPAMTARMTALSRELPGLNLVSFSVDPSDTPADLKSFSRRYSAGWLFLAGPEAEVRRLCERGFRLPVADGGDPSDPITHSSHFVLVDGQNRIRGYFDSNDPKALKELSRQARLLLQSAVR